MAAVMAVVTAAAAAVFAAAKELKATHSVVGSRAECQEGCLLKHAAEEADREVYGTQGC